MATNRLWMAAAMLMAHAPAVGAAEGADKKEAAPLSPLLVPMAEIAVPIIDAGQIEGVLRFTLVLRAKDAASAAMLAEQEPRLRAAALGAGLEFARLRASPYRPVDVPRLSQALDAALRATDPAAERVLIVKVIATDK
jgi:hypothetical protein